MSLLVSGICSCNLNLLFFPSTTMICVLSCCYDDWVACWNLYYYNAANWLDLGMILSRFNVIRHYILQADCFIVSQVVVLCLDSISSKQFGSQVDEKL